jgi:hypothetical protein
MIVIAVSMAFIADHRWAGSPPEKNIATTQSINQESEENLELEQTETIHCPLSQDARIWKLPTFSYWNANDWHPLQESEKIRSVIANINNNNAICKYTTNNWQRMFSIVLPGDYSWCIFENDDFSGFICSK